MTIFSRSAHYAHGVWEPDTPRPNFMDALKEEYETFTGDELVWSAVQESQGRYRTYRVAPTLRVTTRPWRLDSSFTDRALGWIIITELDRDCIEGEALHRCLVTG